MVRIAVLVSGGGTNLQALLDAQAAGVFSGGEICLVVSSSRREFADAAAYDRAMVQLLRERGIDLVVLAGFLSILGREVIAAYPGRILNVHPSLIPAFSGKGFYGLRVHEAALARGVKVTGATVHRVNEIPDGG